MRVRKSAGSAGLAVFHVVVVALQRRHKTDGVRRSKQYRGSVSQRLLRPQFSLLQLKVVFAFSLASSLAKAHARGSLLLPTPRYEKFAHIKIAYALLNSS